MRSLYGEKNQEISGTSVLNDIIGSLIRQEQRSGNENVSPKYNLALSQVFREFSILFTLSNKGELSCKWMGANGTRNGSLISRCFVEYGKKCTEIRATRAARLFLLFLNFVFH